MNALVVAAARLLTRVAAVFLLAMVAINVLDVGLRTGFNAPMFGTYEVVELFLAAAAFLAIPETFLRGEHITIELIDQIVPPRAVKVLRALGLGAALLFVGLLSYHMIEPALELIEFDEVTRDLQYPVIWKGALILAGFLFAVVAVFAVFLNEVRAACARPPAR